MQECNPLHTMQPSPVPLASTPAHKQTRTHKHAPHPPTQSQPHRHVTSTHTHAHTHTHTYTHTHAHTHTHTHHQGSSHSAKAGAAHDLSLPLLLGGQGDDLGLSPDKQIYLAVACASVHLSAHSPQAALTLYCALQPCLARLPANHPNATLVLSCRGYALHAAGQLQDAFEQLVQVCCRVCLSSWCRYAAGCV